MTGCSRLKLNTWPYTVPDVYRLEACRTGLGGPAGLSVRGACSAVFRGFQERVHVWHRP